MLVRFSFIACEELFEKLAEHVSDICFCFVFDSGFVDCSSIIHDLTYYHITFHLVTYHRERYTRGSRAKYGHSNGTTFIIARCDDTFHARL